MSEKTGVPIIYCIAGILKREGGISIRKLVAHGARARSGVSYPLVLCFSIALSARLCSQIIEFYAIIVILLYLHVIQALCVARHFLLPC